MLGIFKGMGITLRHMFRKPVTFQYPDEKRNDLAPRFRGELKLYGVMDEAYEPVETTTMPPCMATCPSNIKIREYVGLVSEGKYVEAVAVIKEDNPLPLVCGRVCPHPCESNCRRGDKDEPVAINNLKRFAADVDLKLQRDGKAKPKKPKQSKKQKVAVIGAGPAGLSCAYYLALEGYKVTIFEKLPVAGGMLAVGIPDYRLPRDILQAEVDQIIDLGVELKLNTPVDDIEGLLGKGFSAVFVGIGAHRPIRLGIDGEDLGGVVPGEDYLREVNLGNKIETGNSVAIVGGGNTAIDCARVAVRQGAKKVYILYRRTRAEMPAHEVEIEDAEAEGVEIVFLAAPKKIIGSAGKVTGAECVRMELGEKDASGRRRPVPVPDSEFVLDVDMVLSAISRVPEVDWLNNSGVEIHSKRGTIVADKITGATTRPGVFAAGDVSLGADIAIAAIGGGKRAAMSIDAYISGKDINEAHKRGPIPAMVKSRYSWKPRGSMPKLTADERLNSYIEVDLGLPEKQAIIDATRCLSCETKLCIGCNMCAESCPVEAITVQATQEEGKRRTISSWDLAVDRCIFCGICVEACPTKTLHHSHKYELSVRHIAELRKDKEYLLRDDADIENEGWSKPHQHVDSTKRLWESGRPRVPVNGSKPQAEVGQDEGEAEA